MKTFLIKSFSPILIDEIFSAANEIENRFPPKDIDDVTCLLASLNLLNAAVKTPVGRSITTYGYIKCHVCLLFVWLLNYPIEGVQIYWDGKALTYFRVPGYQFSFHDVPVIHLFKQMMNNLQPQQWDGLRLQSVALSIFYFFSDSKNELANEQKEKLFCKMRSFTKDKLLCILSKYKLIAYPMITQDKTLNKKLKIPESRTLPYPINNDKIYSLFLAMKFYGFDNLEYELYNPMEPYRMIVMYYNGENYERMVHVFYRDHPQKNIIAENQLIRNTYYYMDYQSRVLMPLTIDKYWCLIARYCYLVYPSSLFNLCISYNIAVYISELYPDLRFIRILHYSRPIIRKHRYTPHALKQVPLRSKSRFMKVWLVVDEKRKLKSFDIQTIPQELIDEFKAMPNYLSSDDVQRATVSLTIPVHDRKLLRELVRRYGWTCIF